MSGLLGSAEDIKVVTDPGFEVGLFAFWARAMGQPDIYPFVLAHRVIAKLHFIHLVVSEERHRADRSIATG